jgi:hypothetical protein
MATITEPTPGQATKTGAAGKRRMIRHQPTKELGERFPAMHLVRSSWIARAIARVLLLLMILLLAASIFLPWQQSLRGEGQVTARLPQLRLQAVESPAKGIISSLKPDLREGSFVEEGEIIMEIKPFAEDAVRLNQEAVTAIQSKLTQYRVIYENHRLQVESARMQGQQAIASSEADVRSANNAFDKATREVDEQLAGYNQAKLERERSAGLVPDVVSEVEYNSANWPNSKAAWQQLKKSSTN